MLWRESSIVRLMLLLLLISIVAMSVDLRLEASFSANVGSSVPLHSPNLATAFLKDYNGSYQRWRDIAEYTYSDPYRSSFVYSQSNATVTYEQHGSTFAGSFNAEGLKPNFAYQLKLMGKPLEDPVSNQHLKDIGRSYDIALNQSVGYVIFDYVVTDRNGEAHKNFSLANSYHVLWKVTQRTPTGFDSNPASHMVEGDPSDLPHAYSTHVGPNQVQIYAEWEKGQPGKVKLPSGAYNVTFIITEESFHSPKGDPGGYWSTVMGCDVEFSTTCIVPDDYSTIQEAINNANEGDTVFVRAGTYYENVTVSKAITLVGENRDTTIIDGDAANHVIQIAANNICISRFTVRNSKGECAGIYAHGRTNITMQENTIYNSTYGICLELSFNITVSRNAITANSFYGITLAHASFNRIYANNVTANQQIGIILGVNASSNMIYENQVSENGNLGIMIANMSNSNLVFNNNMPGPYSSLGLTDSFHNRLYHNNFARAYSYPNLYSVLQNDWDDGYPSGGNYWHNCSGLDRYNGPFQNRSGSDGIGDTPYKGIIGDENAQDNYPLTKPFPCAQHDIGVTYIGTVYLEPSILEPLKTVVGLGSRLKFDIIVFDYGPHDETFNVTVYANSTIIGTIADVMLTCRTFKVLAFTWNIIGLSYGHYSLRACASPVPNETQVDDNIFISPNITIAIPGDADGDGRITMLDLVRIASNYGKLRPISEPNADWNDDGIINILDVVMCTAHYGEQYD